MFRLYRDLQYSNMNAGNQFRGKGGGALKCEVDLCGLDSIEFYNKEK